MFCSNDCSVNLFELGILLFISGVKEWIRTCLQRNRHDERPLLVWDSFRAHLTQSVKADLQRRKIDVALIQGVLTPVLQPLRRKYLNSLPEILNQKNVCVMRRPVERARNVTGQWRDTSLTSVSWSKLLSRKMHDRDFLKRRFSSIGGK